MLLITEQKIHKGREKNFVGQAKQREGQERRRIVSSRPHPNVSTSNSSNLKTVDQPIESSLIALLEIPTNILKFQSSERGYQQLFS